MTLTGPWMPETEREERLLEDVHIATRRAHQDGVSKKRIASLMAFMASATLTPPDEAEVAQSAEEKLQEALDGQPDPAEPVECPNCGELVTETKLALGGEIHAQPCGCTFDWEERDKLGAMAPEEDFDIDEEGGDG